MPNPQRKPMGKPRATSTKTDKEHLKLLSLFHYIVAGLFGLSIVYSGFWMAFASVTTPDPMDVVQFENMDPQTEAAMRVRMESMQSSINRAWYASHVFIFFTMAIRLALVVGLAFGGYALAERKHYQACLVIAIVSCIFIPIGTALGVFTIIVLQRPTVKRMFGQA